MITMLELCAIMDHLPWSLWMHGRKVIETEFFNVGRSTGEQSTHYACSYRSPHYHQHYPHRSSGEDLLMHMED